MTPGKAIVPTRVENKVDPNGGTKQHKRTWGVGVCGKNDKKKKKKGCCYGHGCCFRVPTQVPVSGCPAIRALRNLKERTKAALVCMASMSWIQPTVPSSSSKQPSASSDSHRNQAVEDCITYINSSTTSCSSSSSIVSARSPPPKSSLHEAPQRSNPETSAIAAATIPPPPPPPPPPPHLSPISTTLNKSTAGTPS